MNDKLFKELSKTASKSYLEKGIPLNDSITKLAREHNLNADQVARVCEGANLGVYMDKMASAKDRKFEFKLADKAAVNKELSLSETKPKAKEAKQRDVDYFIKTAAIKESSVFAPEYDFEASFLSDLFTPNVKAKDITIKTASVDPSIEIARQERESSKAFAKKRFLEKEAADNSAKLTMSKLSLQGSINTAVKLIKQAAMSSNPFLIWNEYSSDTLEGLVADRLFSKVAEDLMSRDKNGTIAMLTRVKQAAEHSDYLKENNVAILNRMPIITTIDNISRFTKIIDKLESQRRGEDGIYTLSSTPNPNVDHSLGEPKEGPEYHKALIDKYFPEAIGD